MFRIAAGSATIGLGMDSVAGFIEQGCKFCRLLQKNLECLGKIQSFRLNLTRIPVVLNLEMYVTGGLGIFILRSSPSYSDVLVYSENIQ